MIRVYISPLTQRILVTRIVGIPVGRCWQLLLLLGFSGIDILVDDDLRHGVKIVGFIVIQLFIIVIILLLIPHLTSFIRSTPLGEGVGPTVYIIILFTLVFIRASGLVLFGEFSYLNEIFMRILCGIV